MEAATTAMPAVAPAPPPPLPTFEAFLAWARQTDTRAEWVAGEVVPMSPANLDHQRLSSFLYELMRRAAAANGGEVFYAPIALKLVSRPSGREPDLIYVAAAHADRLRETYIEGPADLVIEIVSPDSDARDRGDKFVEYEAAAIPEYWLVDPLRREVIAWRLESDSRYRALPLDAAGTLASVVLPGLRLLPAWLWQRPLPTLEEALATLTPR
jgi:Uma2 family endonuclease